METAAPVLAVALAVRVTTEPKLPDALFAGADSDMVGIEATAVTVTELERDWLPLSSTASARIE